MVGTRSALFLPVPRLGCVVLDEEHDGSFKQDESLSYQAKEVAWFRMAQTRGLLLLGSATPDVKPFTRRKMAICPSCVCRAGWRQAFAAGGIDRYQHGVPGRLRDGRGRPAGPAE